MTDSLPQMFRVAKPLSMALVLIAVLLTTVSADQDDPVVANTSRGPAQQAIAAEPTGRLIVKYRSKEPTAALPTRGNKGFTRKAWRNKSKLSLERSLSSHRELVRVDNMGDLEGLKNRAKQLSNSDEVVYASVEYRRYPLLEPNDPLYQGNSIPGNQAYLYDGDYSVHAPGAWDITTGSSDSIIAIVDTGVLQNHPAISNRSVEGIGYDFVSADAPEDFFSANDNDGRDNNPTDPGDPCFGDPSTWHGTAVASVAAGNSNDAEGFAAIDWNARLLHARALGICGGTDADIIDAIRWSAGLSVTGIPDNQNPANVVNLSLGGNTECTKAWQDVIDELSVRKVVFVMAAGNERSNALRSAPANCANVITVGSSTSTGDVDTDFSNYGVKVTISTNGSNIIAASNRGSDESNIDGSYYRTETGTSFSAAIVSGAISLIHSINPYLGPAGVRALLQESATDFADNTDCNLYHCGGGVLNLSRALTMLTTDNFSFDRDIGMEVVLNQAIPISLQQEINAGLYGYKDIRYFSFEVPERGLFQAESSGNNDLYGYLLNEQLSVVALDDDSGAENNFRVASLVEAGTYYLAIERARHRQSDGEIQFSVSSTLTADSPAPFTFAAVTNAAANSQVTSDQVRIDGLSGDSIITVSDGFYSLNNGAPINAPGTVSNGDTLNLTLYSAEANGRTNTVTVSVGAYTTTFSATTGSDNTLSSGGNSGSSSGCATGNVGNAAFDPLLLLYVLLASVMLRARKRVSATRH